jgi:hypothetical protein
MALNLDAIGEKIGRLTRDYTWKDVALYALGVGASFEELEYVYEDRLKVIPSFSIASIFDFLAETAVKANVDLSGILHGEQDIIFHSPIPPDSGTLTTQGALSRIYDKGTDKGALVISEADTFHSNGQKLFTSIATLFSRKDGGFGGEQGPVEPVQIPEKKPDFEETALPSGDQPLLTACGGTFLPFMWIRNLPRRADLLNPLCTGSVPTGTRAGPSSNTSSPGNLSA